MVQIYAKKMKFASFSQEKLIFICKFKKFSLSLYSKLTMHLRAYVHIYNRDILRHTSPIMNKKILLLPLAILAAMCFTGCSSVKQVYYFQDIDTMKMEPLRTDYGAVIKKDDELRIWITGPDKTVCEPYNLTTNSNGSGGYGGGDIGTSSGVNGSNGWLTYLVDPQGNIEFPILGKIHVEGMTRDSLSHYLQDTIGKDIKDVIAYVRIVNYKVIMLGETGAGVLNFNTERVTILQAIAQAGDLGMMAKRKNVMLIREVDGVPTKYNIDLTSARIFQEPYYYLQQNDVIYAPANSRKIHQATMSTAIWSFGVSLFGTATSVATLIMTLVRTYK